MSNFITLTIAKQVTLSYRQNKETILATTYQNQNILALSETFSRTDIELLLNQSGCMGIRIYPGMDTSDKVHAILVGVNENDEDMIVPDNQLLSEDDGLILERGVRCPEDCPPESDLNS